MKSYVARPNDFTPQWFVVDATGQILGRMTTQLAIRLRGKHKPIFTPNFDTGDFIIVINADKIILTGHKWDKKNYYHHSGYPGGIKGTIAKKLKEKKPEFLIKAAVRGMLPKNRLGRHLLKKLKIYVGPTHPHFAQHPEPLVITAS